MPYIKLDKISLSFPVYDTRNFSLKNQVVSLATGGVIQKNVRNSSIQALKDINLSFEEGDRVGIVGHNGSGKTTLLKLISGIYEPTGGELYTACKPTPLFDHNLGMDPDATGHQNIILNGLLRGYSRKEIEEKIPAIAEFSGLGEYIYMPFRTYSAGMATRLGFSLSTSLDPEILLIDEVFGAGDKDFFDKAKKRMEELMDKAKVLLMATHSTELMKRFCNKVIVLKKGQIIAQGDVETLLSQYG